MSESGLKTKIVRIEPAFFKSDKLVAQFFGIGVTKLWRDHLTRPSGHSLKLNRCSNGKISVNEARRVASELESQKK